MKKIYHTNETNLENKQEKEKTQGYTMNIEQSQRNATICRAHIMVHEKYTTGREKQRERSSKYQNK